MAQPSHTSVSNYGIKPAILINPNEDNSYDVAMHLNGASKIQILSFDKDGALLGRLVPDSLAGAKGLLGMARITDDGGFAVGYSKDSPHSGSAYEFWVTRIDAKGGRLFSTLIFGSMDKTLVDAKGEPGTASSGRLIYNRGTKKICAYVGHSMKWDDGVRHQGGYLGFLNLEGVNLTSNGWYFSHNFDQRIMVVGNNYYTLAHGDAYPRALGFGKWSDGGASAHTKGKQEFSKDFLKIPGAVGDNKTSTQLGNMVSFADGTFGVVFATANGRNNFDVGYRQLSATGDTSNITWLTSHPANTLAIFPRIAKYGANVLLLWEQVVGTTNGGIQTAVLAPNGSIVTPAAALADKSLRLSPYYDVITLPDGTVMWANQKGNDSVSIFKISAPSSPVGPRFPVRSAAMELRMTDGKLHLLARSSGVYRIRQYNASGRVLLETKRDFLAGRHALPAIVQGVSLVEVETMGERVRLAI